MALLPPSLSGQSVLSFDVDHSLSRPTYIIGCTPVTLLFTFINTEDDPSEGVSIDLLLDPNRARIVQPSAFSANGQLAHPDDPNSMLNRFTLSGLSVPGTDDPVALGVSYVSVSLIFDGAYLDSDHEIHYRVCEGAACDPFVHQNMVPNLTYAKVGTTNGQTDVSALATGQPGELLVIPGDQGFQEVLIKGTLHIDENYAFGYSSELYLEEGAAIIVDPGIDFGLKGTTTVEGCEFMWQGIEVEVGASLVIDGDNPGPNGGVLVQDALNGVRLNDGASLSIHNTTFMNNNRSITTPQTFANKHFDFAISGLNHITSDGNMKAPYAGKHPQYGMYLWGLNGVTIAGSDGSNTIEISHVARGIHAVRSQFTLDRLLFHDIYDYEYNLAWPQNYNNYAGTAVRARGLGLPRKLTYTGFDGAQTDIHECLLGVEADDMSTDISRVHMTGVNYGINVRNSDGRVGTIKNNVLNVNSGGVGLYSNMPMLWFDLLDNEITVDDKNNTTNSAKGIGIRALENSFDDFAHYQIAGNVINVDNGEKGIFFNSGKAPYIRYNTINLLDAGREGYYGIDMLGTVYPIVRCNLVAGNGGMEDWLSAKGANITDISQGFFHCNDVQNTDIGFNFQNLDDATVLKGNFINDHHLGLRIGPFAKIGEQKHAGNQWLGFGVYGDDDDGPQNGNYGAYLESGAEPNYSKLLIDESTENAFYPSYNSSNWFIPGDDDDNSFYCETETSNTCPDGIGSYNEFTGEDPKEIDALDYGIAEGGLKDTICEEAVNWTGQRRLYRRLLQSPGLYSSNTAMQNFINSNTSTTVGEFAVVEAGIIELMAGDTNLLEEMENLGAARDEKLSAIWAIDSTIAAGVSAGVRDTLLQERALHLDTLATVTDGQDSVADSILGHRQTRSLELQSMNNNVTDNKEYEKNEKTFNDIFLKTLAVGIDTFTSQQLSDLEYIANQCPKCGGDAVYRARSLYALHDPLAEYNDDALCYPSSSPLMGPPPVAFDDFLFYPNPAVHGVIVAINPDMGEMEREVQVFSLEGKLFARSTIPSGTWKYQISTAGMPAGTYFFSILENGKKLHTDKITILK
ncbi:MAG: T9SS type A sorting domain-containing protein [Saprospiraceae bacterium]